MLFDALLEPLLTPETHVLEAGCGHGTDAKRFGPLAAGWTGYDFVPEMLGLARANAPEAEFVLWDSAKEPVPEALRGRFDLVVTRRGPTSFVSHLRELCRPGAKVLAIHPGDEADNQHLKLRLGRIGLEPSAEWTVRVRGSVPTLEDFLVWREYQSDERSREELVADWNENATEHGYARTKARYVWLAQL